MAHQELSGHIELELELESIEMVGDTGLDGIGIAW